MKKVFVLGSGGMAGHVIKIYLKSIGRYIISHSARNPYFDDTILLDVINFEALERVLADSQPDVVINCIGVLVQDSENNPDRAIMINGYLPHFLAKLGNKQNWKLIHLSTDCVFSGKDGNYTERSYCDGNSTYARSKAMGEVVDTKNLTIRTSIIGPEIKNDGTGLLNWFFCAENEVEGYSRAFWSGVTTLELAKAIDWLLIHDLSGLVHLCPSEKISKYDLLRIINKVWKNNKVKISDNNKYVVDKSLVNSRRDFYYEPPLYLQMCQEMAEWMSKHKRFYLHYSSKIEI